jgi:hypothetical protein
MIRRLFQILKSKEQEKYLKSFILWDITPHSPVKVNQSFGENVASIIRIGSQLELASILFGNLLLRNVGCLSEDVTLHRRRCENLRFIREGTIYCNNLKPAWGLHRASDSSETLQ